MKNKKRAFSKSLVIFVMACVIEVIVYAEVAMFVLGDLSALYVLLGGVVTAGIAAIISMMLKSKAENTQGGITYDLAMRDSTSQGNGESGEEHSVG